MKILVQFGLTFLPLSYLHNLKSKLLFHSLLINYNIKLNLCSLQCFFIYILTVVQNVNTKLLQIKTCYSYQTIKYYWFNNLTYHLQRQAKDETI